jgi:hypothetical protein
VDRVKDFESTGIAPLGKLYAGDLNAIQDAAAALHDFAQTIDLAAIHIGQSDLQLFRYGAGLGTITSEARLSGSLRIDGIFRPLGGDIPPTFTTSERDAIPAGMAPYGLRILNTTLNRMEWNSGTDVARVWRPLSSNSTTGLLSAGPPSSPLDGDIWIATNVDAAVLPSNTLGIRWAFQYNAGSASAYKWEFIGGAPLSAEVLTQQPGTVNTGYVDLATIGPSVAISRAGEYIVRHTTWIINLQANAGYVSLSGCGITPSADDSVVLSSGNVGTTLGGTVSKAARRTLTVGTLKLQYSTVGGSALGFQNRLLDVIPVRIS